MTLKSIRLPTAATAAAAALLLAPALSFAQAAPLPAASATRPAAAASAGLTRAEVSAEVQRAMRDGTWRCATTNRGWCGITPDDQGVARNPRRR